MFAFCIRNQKAELFVSKGISIHVTNSLDAEAISIKKYLLYCTENEIQRIKVESYSWMMVQILNRVLESLQIMTILVNSIRTLVKSTSLRVVHSFWEGNTHAYYFSNLVVHFAGRFQYNNIKGVPSIVKRIIYLRRSGTRNIQRNVKINDNKTTNYVNPEWSYRFFYIVS